MKMTIRLILAAFSLLSAGKLSAQTSSTGKVFFLSFMEMEARTGGYPDSLLVYITSEVNTTVVIDNPRIGGTNQTMNITAGKVNRYSADPGFYYPQGYEAAASAIESKRSLRITAKDPINVYTLNLELNRSDGTFVLPYESIPKAPEFYIAAFTPTQTAAGGKYMPSEFVVVGMDNNVDVEITPTVKLASGKAANTAFTVTLTKGQVYQVQSDFSLGNAAGSPSTVGDLTGTKVRVINGCGKINVFSGMRSVRIPGSACGVAVDHLYTQVFPTKILGKKHVLMPFALNTKGYVFKVIATKPNTKISIDGTYIGSIKNAGQQYYEDVTSAVAKCVTADSPVYVVQYMKNGGACSGTGGNNGDPAILIMPDQSQKMLKAVVGTATTNNMNIHYVNILVAKAAKGIVYLNGTLISSASFTDVPLANHSYAQIKVANPSTNTITCDSGLICVMYGMGQYESYSYCSGALFESLDYDIQMTRASKCPNYPVSLKAVTNVKNVKKYLWDFGDGFKDTGKSVVHSFKKTGSFYTVLSIIVPAPCGSTDTLTKSLIVNVLQGPLYDIPDTMFQCAAALNLTFTAPSSNKYLYKWRDSSTKNTFKVTTPQKVWIRITDTSSNCKTFDSTVVKRYNAIQAKIAMDTTRMCIHTNFYSLSDSSKFNGDNYKSAQWVLTRWGHKDSTVKLPRFRFTFDTTGTFPLQYQVVSKLGCRDTAKTILGVYHEPTAQIWTKKPEYCQKEDSKFIDSSFGQGGIQTGNWDFGDGGKATGLTVTHKFNTFDTFKVELITQTIYGCKDTADSMIIIHPLPVMKLTSTINNPCKKANSFSFVDGSTVAYGTMVNTWKYMNKTGSGFANLINVKFTDTGNWKVRLFNTTDKGCTDSINKVVYVAPEPVAKIALTDSLQCFDVHFFDLKDASTLGSGTIGSRKWTFSDGTTSTLKTISKKTFASYGSYNTKLVVTTATYGCKDSATRSLVVFAAPLAPFTVNDSEQCLLGNSFAFAPVTPFTIAGITPTYAWTFGDANTANTASATHAYTTSGKFKVTYIVSTNQGCADTAIRTMQTDPTPVAAFSASKDSACYGTYKFDFTNKTVFAPGFISYWSLGDGSKANTTDVLQKNYASAATYPVKLVISSIPGCKDSITHNVTVMPVPAAGFNVNNASQCLATNNFVFSNQTNTNGATGMVYQWVFTPGATFNTQNIANQVMVDTGTYLIKLTSTSSFGCTDNFTKSIYVAESPTVTISGNDACVGEDIQFDATGKINSGSITSYAWTFGDGGNSTVEDPLHMYATAGPYNVSCTVTSDKGCTATATPLVVNIFPLPKADFTSEQLVSRGMQTDHKLTFTGSGATNYLWSFYDGRTDNTGGPVLITFSDTGHKATKLWVISSDGCVDSITKYIYLKPELQMWISLSFTPNNDGLNETFGPSTTFGLSKYKMEIFDRWGEKMFDTRDPKVPWDGLDKNRKQAPEGVYAYEISFRYIDGKIFVYQGTVTLLR